ncbi:MAG: C45 family autoproteolytic acyltransferase/hydrolase [Thermonemataceae bacterium]
MYHPRLYGTFYEMGLKYGKLLYEKAGFQIPAMSVEKENVGRQSYPLLKAFYPEVIEEIDGFAAGIQADGEKLAAFLLSIGLFEQTGQCSVFAYKEKEQVFVGRNYDMLFAFKKFTESSLIVPDNRFAAITQSDVFIGRVDGINEKGLFMAMSFVNGKATQPGINFYFIIRKVLEDCATTQEAIDLLMPVEVSSASNFMIADRTGDLAVVESAPEKKYVRRPESHYIYMTNQFISEEMKALDIGGIAWSKSQERYTGLTDRLEQVDRMTLAKAKAILSDDCICLNLKKQQFGTLWSVVANLSDLTIERAESKPTTKNFKPETRLAWWLNKQKS